MELEGEVEGRWERAVGEEEEEDFCALLVLPICKAAEQEVLYNIMEIWGLDFGLDTISASHGWIGYEAEMS